MYELRHCEPWTKAFFCSILWGRWAHNCPLEYWVKFGYRSKRKVDLFFWTPQYFDHMQDPISKSGNFKFFFHEIWQLWAILAKKNPLYESLPLFSVSKCQNSATKKKSCTVWTEKSLSQSKEHKVRSVNVRWCKLNWKDIVKVKSYITSTPQGKLPFMW
jgi:hypothetical protein